jgi:sulfate/thiosulfate transport system ATP-binding protein
MSIDILTVSKRFGDFVALDTVSLHVRSGELMALLGPSGSGKTTLLRIIAGLDWPDEGEIRFDGEDALERSVRDRRVGFVFQHYALFRHMTVYENVAFGLRVRPRRLRFAEAEIARRVNELLELVQIGWLAKRYPDQLSGGQRQRVALARALAIEPKVLLLDEPFGALDAKVRKDLRRWLRSLHNEIHVTSVFVTHDQEEALEVADRVVVMDKGRIEQVGLPHEVHERPATAFVHDFIGESISLPVRVEGGAVHFESAVLPLESQGVESGPARLFIRPYEMSIVAPEAAALTGTVRDSRGFGGQVKVDVAVPAGGETVIEVVAPRGARFAPGEAVGLKPERYRIFGERG